jgi:hypothetical protein
MSNPDGASHGIAGAFIGTHGVDPMSNHEQRLKGHHDFIDFDSRRPALGFFPQA